MLTYSGYYELNIDKVWDMIETINEQSSFTAAQDILNRYFQLLRE